VSPGVSSSARTGTSVSAAQRSARPRKRDELAPEHGALRRGVERAQPPVAQHARRRRDLEDAL